MQVGTQREREVAARQRHQRTADRAVEAVIGALRAAVLHAVRGDRFEVVVAGLVLQAERVQGAVREAVQQAGAREVAGLVVPLAQRQAIAHAGLVVPVAQVAVGGQQQALVDLVVARDGRAEVGHRPRDGQRLVRDAGDGRHAAALARVPLAGRRQDRRARTHGQRLGRILVAEDGFVAARVFHGDGVVGVDLLRRLGVHRQLLVRVQRGAVVVVVQDAGVLPALDRIRIQAAARVVRIRRVLVGGTGEVGGRGVAAAGSGPGPADGGHRGVVRDEAGAIRQREAAALVEVDGAVDVPAVAFQVALAERGLDALLVAAAAALRLHELHGDVAALDLALGDEVDDAADRIRPVDRRRAVAQDLDALQRADRDDVQVGVAVGDGLVGEAAAVQQHEGAVHAQAAQVDVGAGAGVGRLQRRRLRQRHHHVGQRGHALLDQFLGLDGRDGQGFLGGQALDAGAGDFHALDRRVGLLGLRLLGEGKDRERDRGHDEMAGLGAAGVFHEAVSCFYVDDVSASAGGSGADDASCKTCLAWSGPHVLRVGVVDGIILDWSDHKINVV